MEIVHVVGLLFLKHDRKQAEAVYTQLLDRNPENRAYYKGLEDALQPGIYECILYVLPQLFLALLA